MVTRRTFFITSAGAALSCARRKGTGYDGYAFVANQGGQAIAAVDLNTFTLARHIPIEGSPTAVLTCGRAVYALTPANGTLHEINPDSLTFRRRLVVARAAVNMRAVRDGSSLWVLCRQPRVLVRVNLARFSVDSQIALPLDPVDFDLGPDPSTAVVSFGEQGALGLADLGKRSCHAVTLGKRLSVARFRSDGRHILAGNLDDRALAILDARTGQAVVHLPLGLSPQNFCFKSDGGQLFITGEGMDAVAIVYPYSTEVGETALAGRAPGAMAECVSEEFDYLFVTNPETSEVTILDLDTHKAIAVVAVGRGPRYVLPTPDHQYALVLNRESGDMAVIRLIAISARRDRSAPLFNLVPIGSEPVSAVIRHV